MIFLKKTFPARWYRRRNLVTTNFISGIFDTMKTVAEMNAKGWLSSKEVHDYLRRITGREIAPSTTVRPSVRIGYGSIIGANSVVTYDVPPMTVVGGNPAKFIKKIETKKEE